MSFRTRALGVLVMGTVATSGYVFSERSLNHIKETREDLQAVVGCALHKTPIDFTVIDGGRTDEEHKNNVANGKSWVKRSKHQDGLAIDFAPIVNGRLEMNDPKPFRVIAEKAFYPCAAKLGTPITWGGEWRAQDLFHIELKGVK